MPTIRDLVSALRRRDGVQAAIVLGRDGLLIDGAVEQAFDAEGLAAHVPPLITAATELGVTSNRGELGLVVMEYSGGIAVAAAVSVDALLLILLTPSANLAALLYDLRRHRAQIAALV
jgi:predicted regulator of Ras-like GTPase activity (Roadblock/LC7/MglB family)